MPIMGRPPMWRSQPQETPYNFVFGSTGEVDHLARATVEEIALAY